MCPRSKCCHRFHPLLSLSCVVIRILDVRASCFTAIVPLQLLFYVNCEEQLNSLNSKGSCCCWSFLPFNKVAIPVWLQYSKGSADGNMASPPGQRLRACGSILLLQEPGSGPNRAGFLRSPLIFVCLSQIRPWRWTRNIPTAAFT